MTTLLKTLMANGRAALIAIVLGAAAVAAVPTAAMAQSSAPSFSFNFGFSQGGSGFSFGYGNRGPRVIRACLTWSEARQGLRREGWREIELISQTSRRFTVEAYWPGDRRYYSMRIDRCTGEVTNIRRLPPTFNYPHRSPSPGFGLHFQFNR